MMSFSEFAAHHDVEVLLHEALYALKHQADEEVVLNELGQFITSALSGLRQRLAGPADSGAMPTPQAGVSDQGMPIYSNQDMAKFNKNRGMAGQIVAALKQSLQNTSNELMQKFGADNPKVQKFFSGLPQVLGKMIDQQAQSWNVGGVGGGQVKMNDPNMQMQRKMVAQGKAKGQAPAQPAPQAQAPQAQVPQPQQVNQGQGDAQQQFVAGPQGQSVPDFATWATGQMGQQPQPQYATNVPMANPGQLPRK